MVLMTRLSLVLVVLSVNLASCRDIVKREAFQVKSSEEEELTFKNDIIGNPLTDEDFEFASTLPDDEDDVDRNQDFMDPLLSAGMFEGDIRGINDTEGRNGIINTYQKWSGAVIPYVISNHYNRYERALIAKAMKFYHTHTCIKFKGRTNQRDYIHITRGRGCSSHVGRRGGVQYVSLGHGCLASGTIQHELMHAAGFWHEQSRYDRDYYVNIHWQNILSGMNYNFRKFTQQNTQVFGQPYDYKSAMHYGPYAFSKNRMRTITPKQRGATFGRQYQLSKIDLIKLNSLYKCPGTNTGTGTGGKATTKGPTKKKSTTKRPTVTTKPGAKVDMNKFCSSWARKGECTRNAAYMLQSCARSCCLIKQNSGNCQDHHIHCASWARSNQCAINPPYMLVYCKRSCNACGGQANC